MQSDNWTVNVDSQVQIIDGTETEMLVYRYSEGEKITGSRLELHNVSEREFEIFELAIKGFCYPENEIIGKKIFESDEAAVYTRSSKPIPDEMPVVEDFGREGAVFAGYQMCGTCPFDLVVCCHDFKKEDRDRRELRPYEVVELVKDVVCKLTPQCAFFVLEQLKKYWNHVEKKLYDSEDWAPVVDMLLYKIRKSKKAVADFHKKYPNLLCVNRTFTIAEKNKRTLARNWLSEHKGEYRLVKGSFFLLGYSTIEDECEKHGGMPFTGEEVSEAESAGFAILEAVTAGVFGEFFGKAWLEAMPTRKLIISEAISGSGMSVHHRDKKNNKNVIGLKLKNVIDDIYMNKGLFCETGYYDALCGYVYEMCHVFGGERSESFSVGLTWAMEFLLHESETVNAGAGEWERIYQKAA